jgi:hypothetical protein
MSLLGLDFILTKPCLHMCTYSVCTPLGYIEVVKIYHHIFLIIVEAIGIGMKIIIRSFCIVQV